MKYSTYMQYFLDLKDTFSSSHEEGEIDRDFEKIFLSNLLDSVKKAWQDYELLQRESHMLFEDELDKIWNISRDESLNHMLAKLSDLGFIKTAVNQQGDIVYSISEKGADYIHSTKK